MDLKGLDMNLLVALDALLTERNVTRAGERINLSQSATSGALSRLRAFFNDELLSQSGNKLMLTPLAESLAQPVREILLKTESIINVAPNFDPSRSTRRFRLVLSDYATTVLMPGALNRLQHVAPGVTFDLSNIENPLESLERGEIDLLIMPREYISQTQPSEELFDDQLVCVAWRGNSEISEALSLDQYLQLGHIGVRLGKEHLISFDELVFERLGHKRRLDVVAMAFNAVPHMLVGTKRIATMPGRLAAAYAEYLPLKLLQPPVDIPRLHESMQWHRFRAQDSGILWLRTFLKEVISPLPEVF